MFENLIPRKQSTDLEIRLNARDIAEKLGKALPHDVGFAVVLFHKGGERGQYMGTNVDHRLLLRMIDKAKEAGIRDAAAVERPG